MPLRVMIGDDKAAPGRHRPVPPIALERARELGMQVKAAARQRVQRRAFAPVAREEAAGLAGGCIRHLGAFDDDDLDAAAGEKIGGAGADHAAAADHNAHAHSVDCAASLQQDKLTAERRAAGFDPGLLFSPRRRPPLHG